MAQQPVAMGNRCKSWSSRTHPRGFGLGLLDVKVFVFLVVRRSLVFPREMTLEGL